MRSFLKIVIHILILKITNKFIFENVWIMAYINFYKKEIIVIENRYYLHLQLIHIINFRVIKTFYFQQLR